MTAGGSSPDGSGRHARWPIVLVPLALALAPFTPPLVGLVTRPFVRHAADGDLAILELQVRDAGAGEHLLGPYSRFGWNHPGPAQLYLLLPLYRAAGEKTAGLELAALLGNVASAVGIVLLARKRFDLRGAFAAATLVAVFASFLRAGKLISFWNPMATIFPFSLLPFLGVEAALGSRAFVPAYLLVGSVVVQGHVGYTPTVLVLFAAAILRRCFRRARPHEAARPGRGERMAAGVLWAFVVLAWTPPLVQQLSAAEGNLSRLFRFFASERGGHGLLDVLRSVSPWIAGLPIQAAALLVPEAWQARDWAGPILCTVLAAGLVLAALGARSRRDEPLACLVLLTATAAAAALVSLTRVVGDLAPYLTLWTCGIGLAGWLASILALLRPAGDGRRRAPLAVVGAIAVAFPLLAVRATAREVRSWPADRSLPWMRQIAPETEAFLRARGCTAPAVSVASPDAWPTASGLVLELERSGFRTSVDADWVFMFGASRARKGDEDVMLVLSLPPVTEELLARPGHALVATVGGTSVFAVQEPR